MLDTSETWIWFEDYVRYLDIVEGCVFQGVVTSCDRSNVGIFELDHRVSLYVTCVPASHRFTALTLGSKIIVYNAHRKGFAKAPKIRLFCCMASCIRVVDAGKEQSSNKQFSANSLLVKPISVYSLAASDFSANSLAAPDVCVCVLVLRQQSGST
ncbi:uncharacterized protein [Haliotis cracherodii]|uniref:uncharacterized protein n=1 Tax=Haliotis cracherodii TaxID=6455 RepID=UPI0039E8D4E2